MSQWRYYISAERRRWQFEVNGELFGPYSTFQDAMSAAREDARQRGDRGDTAPEFLVRTPTGGWRSTSAADTEVPIVSKEGASR